MDGKYEVIDHSEEPPDAAHDIVSTLLFGEPNLCHKVTVRNKETGDTAEGSGWTYEEAVNNAIEQL